MGGKNGIVLPTLLRTNPKLYPINIMVLSKLADVLEGPTLVYCGKSPHDGGRRGFVCTYGSRVSNSNVQCGLFQGPFHLPIKTNKNLQLGINYILNTFTINV